MEPRAQTHLQKRLASLLIILILIITAIWYFDLSIRNTTYEDYSGTIRISYCIPTGVCNE